MKVPIHTYWQLLQKYLIPQRGAALLMAILLFASIALQLVGPQIVRSFIDAAQAGASEAMLIRAALLFIVVSIVQQAMNVLATYWSERVAWTATNALRVDIAAHLVRLDLSFHKARTPGELIERVDGDVNALAAFFSSFVIRLLGCALLLIGILVAFYFVDIRIGVVFTVFAVLGLLLLHRVRHFGTRHWKEERECSAAFYGYIGELLTAAEDVRSSGAVPYALRRFFEHRLNWLPVALQADLWGGVIWMVAVGIFAVGDATAYGLSGGLYRMNALSLGEVYLVVAYAAMLVTPIDTLRTQLQDLQKADASIARVRELLEIQSRLEDGSENIPCGRLSVEFHNVCFRYEDNDQNGGSKRGKQAYVLDNLSFTLRPGRVLGLLGPTGSGKTTIARLLFRMYDPQQGEIRLGGVNLRCARIEALRARIGLVTQDVQLFEASLRDNISFFDPDITDQQLLSVLEALELQLWLERLPQGLDTMISSSVLSAGEAQLIALARVFIKDPGLVILDEASSRLDPATETLLEKALDRLLEGRVAIIIAHRLASVDRADDILILDHGTVLEYGPREQLAADGLSRLAELRRIGLGDILV